MHLSDLFTRVEDDVQETCNFGLHVPSRYHQMLQTIAVLEAIPMYHCNECHPQWASMGVHSLNGSSFLCPIGFSPTPKEHTKDIR
eukprot:5698011-Amphidinium_carterae.1